jgi:hypothetical protein
MTAQDFTVALFCRVDEAMPQARKHLLSKLHPSEVVIRQRAPGDAASSAR